ncbi:MAG: DUF1223 domain-containing protein [Ferruginibacter sp.]
MKKGILLLCALVTLITVAAYKTTPQFQPVAVIELFTSQGCSSCPSADRLLTQTINDAKKNGRKIFALSFHVDYWNRLGWSDPFSAKEYSQRQNDYATRLNLNSVYTPQMIVNGSSEFVGSDKRSLDNALSKSLNTTPSAAFKTLTASLQAENLPKVKFTLDGNYSGCNINFALVSLSETTSIKRGENSGLTLKNENVVRQFISIAAKAEGEINFKKSPMPANNNMAIVAYIQNRNDLKIIGASMAEIN